ncbi:hypothetical protein NCS57_01009700 [Fusarium keratoplasticum]|uniref:Uncharacterized protein n=1 Tax=Fusarium keratoplasticum TaxID=1328300 RepID=A0ACC0QNF7_9HYPO|nr:hypothetical protein NCS57_01009700 [Fusarium keratoplasticum]KAI8660328.1 hypothetical protein NCS57_01009700 [Fusarium keratoplasticum]
MGLPRSLLLAVAASTYFTQPALASDDDECSGTLEEIREGNLVFNSTMTVAFAPSPGVPWLFTLGLSDWREEGSTWGDFDSSQHIETFLSIPNDIVNSTRASETRVCIYMMDGQNATANDGNKSGHSCNGVLSDECQKALRSIKGPADDGTCPDPPDSVKEACNQYVYPQWGTPQTYNNTNCTTSSLPGVGLPGGYKTFPVVGTSLFPADSPIDSYKMYDLRVRQPIPFLFTMEFHDEGLRTATELLCVAPSQLMKGSRKPEGEFPPSAASGLDTKGAVVLAVGVWSVVGLLLA